MLSQDQREMFCELTNRRKIILSNCLKTVLRSYVNRACDALLVANQQHWSTEELTQTTSSL